ncbi:acyl-CoA dehydrogenase family protein [Rhodopirellula sp. JC639]|uniref:acyl-CoA dehydrogenase family protein n=1 Tax=Stieleria mannarensis TaxID=2755585 RepID=UPI001602C105|nr:acyl-CoA dehydrogenase family protein [Rhodopirellula sp. JC639]
MCHYSTPPGFQPLCQTLASLAPRWRTTRDWPAQSLSLCGQHGIFYGLTGFEPPGDEQQVWTAAEQIETLIELARADLLTTFVITQHLGAIKRIAASDRLAGDDAIESGLQTTVLPSLLDGSTIGSVGISHLTTSRLHLDRPAVVATEVDHGYRLRGTIPWVTGAPAVGYVVVGATLDDATQILALISPNDPGVYPGPGAEMIAMTASCTDAIELRDVFVPQEHVLSGPRENVLVAAKPTGDAPSGAGGLQTSALALGLSYAALDYLRDESDRRDNLTPIVDRFRHEHQQLHETIRAAANGDTQHDSATIRSLANGLVARTTAAAMTTAKGAGMMTDHPVGRWCQQALFFLVWSCPQPVAQAHLCDLAGLE